MRGKAPGLLQPQGTDDLGEIFPRAQRRPMLVCSLGLSLLALIVRIPFLGQGIAASDTIGAHLPVARGLLDGQGFPNSFRPPAFPILLAVFEQLGIDPVDGIVLLQNLIGIVLPVCVLLIGWRYFSPAAGLLAGFLAAASPLMIATEQVALPDYLFGAVFLLGSALLAEAAIRARSRRVSWQLLVAVGVVFGIATMFRPNGQLAFVLIPAAILLGARSWRFGLRSSAIAVGGLVIALAPWVLHNWISYGEPVVSSEGGVSLYGRVITSEGRPPPADTPDGRTALNVYNTGAPTVAVLNAFVYEGRSISDASRAMGAIAREAVFEDPGSYLDGTWRILERYADAYNPHTLGANGETDQIALVRREARVDDGEAAPGDSPLTRVPWQVAQTLTGLIEIVTLAGLLALLLPFVGRPSARIAATTFLLVVGMGIVAGSFLVRFELRFGLMFAPLVWLLLAAATVSAIQSIASLGPLRRARGRLRGAEA
jgi:4-amino-4-deoxy-L-arabinose transferase-like glycosyltransferase